MPKRIFIIAIILFCCAYSTTAQSSEVQLKTVVIDAGHGGHDSGALSKDSKIKEKDVVLDIALNLGNMIKEAYPDVNVIYTRSTDVFPSLEDRTNIANQNNADLFISIHSNSVPKNKTAPSGCETFIMGMNKSASNMEVCKIENSVVLLEDDYSAKYQGYDPNDPESFIFFNLLQNSHFEQSLLMADLCQKHLKKGPISGNRGVKQGGLLVLWRTTMPSVLVELGFITNANDRNILASKDKRKQISSRLFDAFSEFKSHYDGSVPINVPIVEEVLEQKPEVAPSSATSQDVPTVSTDFYAIQIFAISRNLKQNASEYKGLKSVEKYPVGKIYKYVYGQFASQAQAEAELTKIRAKFRDAFVVKVINGEVVKN